MEIGDIVEINTFDDGNHSFRNYKNIWIIEDLMFNGGKTKLKNRDNHEIIIRSISSWKVNVINLLQSN